MTPLKIMCNQLRAAKKRTSVLEDRLVKINRLIYAKGAPLGSDTYFKIRGLVAETEREVAHVGP